MDYCKFLIVIFAVAHIASTQTVVDGDCATLHGVVYLNCTIQNTSGNIIWFQNQDFVAADCSSFDDRIEITKCEKNLSGTSYFDIKILNFTNGEEGNWTCSDSQASGTEEYKLKKEEGANYCDDETYPQPSQRQSCTLHFGSCESEFNLDRVCAFPEPLVKLYRNGEDISDEVTIDENPDFTCSDPLDYKISASYKVKPTKKETVTYVYEVSYIEYPNLVFHSAEFVMEHTFCVWCLFLFPIIPVAILVGILIYCYYVKKYKNEESNKSEINNENENKGKANPTYTKEDETKPSHGKGNLTPKTKEHETKPKHGKGNLPPKTKEHETKPKHGKGNLPLETNVDETNPSHGKGHLPPKTIEDETKSTPGKGNLPLKTNLDETNPSHGKGHLPQKTNVDETNPSHGKGNLPPKTIEDETKSTPGKRSLPPNKKWLLSVISTGEERKKLAKISRNGEFKTLLIKKKNIQRTKKIRILKNKALVSIEENTDMEIICFDGSKIKCAENETDSVEAITLVAEDNISEILAIVHENRLLAIQEPTKYNVLISLSNTKENIVNVQKLPSDIEAELVLYYEENTEKTPT